LAGATQGVPKRDDATNFSEVAWLEIYESRFPGRSRWSSRLSGLRPMLSTALGGDMTLLFARVPETLSASPKG
ncbi:hypothetical protein, partial [Asticcacaulis sp. AC460]